jgi:hypothetical protein
VADRIAVATKRAIAEGRLRKAVESLGKTAGVKFVPPAVPAKRFPDLYAAQLVEQVADFLTRLEKELP